MRFGQIFYEKYQLLNSPYLYLWSLVTPVKTALKNTQNCTNGVQITIQRNSEKRKEIYRFRLLWNIFNSLWYIWRIFYLIPFDSFMHYFLKLNQTIYWITLLINIHKKIKIKEWFWEQMFGDFSVLAHPDIF